MAKRRPGTEGYELEQRIKSLISQYREAHDLKHPAALYFSDDVIGTLQTTWNMLTKEKKLGQGDGKHMTFAGVPITVGLEAPAGTIELLDELQAKR